MLSRVMIGGVLLLAAAVGHANVGCDDATMQQYRTIVRIVDTLRPEKAGQQRVFLADGSEFNAGQAQWMKARLHEYAALCAHGRAEDRAEAARILADVQDLLNSHKRRS
jgi:hypothetical protein